MKALVGAFNQEKALVGAFSVIVEPVVEPMDSFTALVFTETQSDSMTEGDPEDCCCYTGPQSCIYMVTGYYNYADEITPKQTININDMMGTLIKYVIRGEKRREERGQPN